FQIEMDGRIRWRNHSFVLDKVAEVRLFVLADWRLEGHRLLRNLFCFADRVDGKVHALSDFLRSWFAPEFLHQLPAGARLLVDRLNHVHRHADGARLIRDGACDALANPPSRVRRELVAAAPLELVGALHETDIPLLN